MIEFHLDAGSGLSPYLQIVRQVRHALRLGLLREGDQLPTVKDVVARLALNPNTVLKAYRELEHEGLVSPRPGLGTFVTRPLTDETTAAHGPLRPEARGGRAGPGTAAAGPGPLRRAPARRRDAGRTRTAALGTAALARPGPRRRPRQR